jgi:hypothetical protein
LIAHHGELAGEGVEGEEKQGRGGVAALLKGGTRGRHGASSMRRALGPLLLARCSCFMLLCMCGLLWKRTKKEREKRERRKGRGKRKWENYQNQKISVSKKKSEFMELV